MLSQLLASALFMGAAQAMIAISFALIYSVSGIFHIAHAGVYAVGAYMMWWFLAEMGLPILPAAVAALMVTSLLGGAIYWLIYRNLIRRDSPHLVIMITALGLLAILDNTMALLFSTNTLFYPTEWGKSVLAVGNLRLTSLQLWVIAISLILLFAYNLLLNRTPLGRRIRAVSANPMMAELGRLAPERVYLYVFLIASATVGLAGILVAADVGIRPYSGMQYFLTAAIAVIAAGVGQITGAFIVAVAISILQNVSLIFIQGHWAIVVTFLVFLLAMLFFPQGIFNARGGR